METQWGVRYGQSADAAAGTGVVIRRTVTYGPWEELPA